EDGVFLVAYVVELTGQCGADHGTGIAELDASAYAIGTCNPAGVDEPYFDASFADFIAEEFCVAVGVQRNKGFAKAGGEDHLGLGNTYFGSGDLSGIAGNKMIHGLLGRQL